MSKLGPISHFLSPVSCDSLVLQGLRCEWGAGVLHLVLNCELKIRRKVEERKVSNIHQLRDVIMEEWKRTSVDTCEALVNSKPKRVKAVMDNNGGHTKY